MSSSRSRGGAGTNLHFHWLREIENFFATYKLLEEKDTELLGWEDAANARRVIEEARRRHEEMMQEGEAH